MASDPVLSTTTNTGPLPGEAGPSNPVLPGNAPPPLPDPEADVVDPSPDEPPVLPEPPEAS